MVPGSHLWGLLPGHRDADGNMVSSEMDPAERCAPVRLPCAAGTAVLFHNLCFHGRWVRFVVSCPPCHVCLTNSSGRADLAACSASTANHSVDRVRWSADWRYLAGSNPPAASAPVAERAARTWWERTYSAEQRGGGSFGPIPVASREPGAVPGYGDWQRYEDALLARRDTGAAAARL